MNLITALCFMIILASSCADKKVLNCFNRSAGRAIANANPLAELYNLTPYECMRFCLSTAGYQGQRCYAIVFHLHYHTCQLYDHAGSKPPSFKVPAFGHDFYVRISEAGDCKSPEIPSQPALPPASGPVAGNLPSAGYAGKSANVDKENSAELDDSSSDDGDDSSSDDGDDSDSDKDYIGNESVASKEVATANGLESILPSSNELNCDFGQKLGFFVTPAYELAYPADTISIVVNGTDDDFCSILCKDNADPSGAPINCAAYSYFPFDKKCVMHTAKAYPNGKGRLAYNKDSIYSEKFCQPVAAPESCPEDELFLEFPKLELMGFDVTAELEMTDDLIGCMQLCVVNSEYCRSVVYKADKKVCMLKTTDFTNNPEAFQEAPSNTFFVENGCVTNAVSKSFDDLEPVETKLSVQLEMTDKQPVNPSDEHATTPLYDDNYYDEASAKFTDPRIDQYIDFNGNNRRTDNSDYTLISSDNGSNDQTWGEWTPCQFEVVGNIVRVRTLGCDIFKCEPGKLEVEKCA